MYVIEKSLLIKCKDFMLKYHIEVKASGEKITWDITANILMCQR